MMIALRDGPQLVKPVSIVLLTAAVFVLIRRIW